MADKMLINVNIEGFNVRLNINRDDEELYRASARMLKDLYRRLGNSYTGMSAQELWMMTAYQVMVARNRREEELKDGETTRRLKNLEDMLDKALEA